MARRHLVIGGRGGQGPEVEQPEGLRAKLWRLHDVVVQRVLERLESGVGITPAWIGVGVALLRLNDCRVAKSTQTVVSGLQRLGSLASALGQPFSPGGTTTPVTTTADNNEDNEE